MDSDLFQQTSEIFLEARRLGPEERGALLMRRCGENAALREQVEILLGADKGPDPFDTLANELHGIREVLPLTPSAPWTDAAVSLQRGQKVAVSEGPGAHIGRYKLLQLIGEGGFGSVFMAEQEKPVRRRVALKIIKLGMDTRQVIARFEAERQALAMMDHPSVAKVLDGGATDTGRPYFVMELVKGTSITEYCDKNNLSIPKRLELFGRVCEAVQHAHQKGLIHRDIKPSNVLVSTQDDRPVVKVIDFGIAKAIQARLTEKTLFTDFRQMIGTPEYMSPEQAEGDLDIDTRCDVYSLGVLLYELLAGSPPFDARELRSKAFAEMQRIIREVEPPAPSTRLGTIKDTLASVAAHRAIEPRKLAAVVRGELDWIVMRCLEKDRKRRYQTASALAEDIQHYLTDEPVQARPPTMAYRFRKFARRHRAMFVTSSTATIAVLLAVVGLAISNVRITREKHQKEIALQDKEVALGEKEAALTQAKANYTEAQRQEGLAKEQERLTSEQELLARRRFYAAQMNLAMQAWEAGQPARTLQLLESQRPRFDQDDLRGFDWYYLWRLCQGTYRFSLPARNYEGGSPIAISPDGTTLASGYGHTVRLWNVSTGRQNGELLAHDNLVSWVAFAPDGKTLASTDDSESVKLWDLATQQERTTLRPGQIVRSVQFTGDSRLLALAGEKSVQLWHMVTNQKVTTVGESDEQSPNRHMSVAVSPDGNTVAANGSKKVRIWTRDGNAWREAPPLTGAGYYPPLAISPDGKLLAVGYNALKLYDLPSGRERIALQGHTGPVFGVAFTRDGKRLASGGQDRTVRMWDVATGKQQACIANPGPVYGVALAPDVSVVAATGIDAILVWEVAPPALASLLRHAAPVRAVAFSPDGKTLASYGMAGTKLWDPVEGREVATLAAAPPPQYSSYGLAFSPDGKSLATSGDATGAIDLWDVPGRRRVVLKTGAEVCKLAFSPDGKSLAEASGNGTVAVWDLASQQRRLAMPVSNVASVVAFSPDGKTIAAGGQFGVVKLFDAQSGRELTTLQRNVLAVDWLWALAYSPDGRKLATGNRQGVVHIWDVATNQLDASLIGHTDAVQSLAFADEGRTLASASDDRTIRLWDVATGQERIALKGHEGGVTGVAFTPDGNVLATSSTDGTVRLWHVAMDADARARKREVDADDPRSPAAQNERGDRLWQYGRTVEAEAAYRQALDRLEKLGGAFPNDPAYPQEMVRSLLSVGLLLRVERDPHPEAEPARLQARAIYKKLSQQDQAAMFWAYSERHRHLYDTGNTKQQVDRTYSEMIELVAEDDVGSLIQAARHLAFCADAKLRDRPRAVELARQAVAVAAKDRKDRVGAIICLGDILESDGRITEAKELYQQAIVALTEDLAVTPTLSNTWTGRAFAHFHLHQWEEAVADFTKAIELAPDVHTNWFHRGHAYIALAQFDKAAADLTRVVEGWPHDNWSWFVRAQIYALMHRPAESVADLRHAVAEGFTDLLRMQTDAWLEPIRDNNEFKKLLAELEIRLLPTLSNIQRAEFLWNAGRLDEAIQVCSEILREAPDNVAVWNERGNCYLRKGAFARAVEDFTHAIKLEPDHGSAWHERGYCYLMLGQHEKAIADHTRSIELGDHDAGQRLRRGNSYEALGETQKAEEDYSRATQLNPSYYGNWFARAQLYARRGQANKAQADLANAIKHCSSNPDDQNALAWALATNPDPQLRNPKMAVELAEKAVAARPTAGGFWNTLGVARYQAGDYKQAVTTLEKSIQLRNGGSSEDFFFLAMAHHQLGHADDARRFQAQAIQWMKQHAPQSRELLRFQEEAARMLGVPATKRSVGPPWPTSTGGTPVPHVATSPTTVPSIPASQP